MLALEWLLMKPFIDDYIDLHYAGQNAKILLKKQMKRYAFQKTNFEQFKVDIRVILIMDAENFEVDDYVLHKIQPEYGVTCFKIKGNLASRSIKPFIIIKRVRDVVYRLKLP